MRRLLLLLLVTLSAVPSAFAADADHAAIVAAVEQAYVRGIHIDADPDKVRAGMHETFIMFVPSDKGITHLTRDAWIARMKPGQGRADTKADIQVLDRAGNAAVVKVDLFREGKQIFTDYISLYNTPEGWKLVGKIYHRH
jgi:hypothetical protein